MAYCNKDIQTMLTECQPTLSTIQHFTNNEYSRFSKDKDAIGQVAQAISAKKPNSHSKLHPSPASIHEQAMAAISLEDDEDSDELSTGNTTSDKVDENAELKNRLAQLEAELASLRASADAAQATAPATRRRVSESLRRPLPPPIATNWATGPSASAPAGSKRMLSPSIVAPTSSSTAAAASSARSPTHNSAIQTPEELIAGSDTPKYVGLPQFKKIRQGASPESLQPLDFAKRPAAAAPETAVGAGLVYFSPSHLAGMPQQPRSSEAMMLLCSPTAGAGFDKSPMHRGLSGLSGLSPRVLLQPPSTSAYQPMRPMSGRGMSLDLQSVFGAHAQAWAASQGQACAFPPSSTQGENYAQDSASALSGFDTVGRDDSWSLEHLLAPTQQPSGLGRPPLSPAHGLCTPLGRGPAPIDGACAGLRV